MDGKRIAVVGLFVAAAAGLIGLGAQTPAHTPPAHSNVVLVTIDTVRADHLGAFGYANASTPVMDRLAKEGVRFADATTQAPLTAPAHAALLTGVYPARLGVRDNATTPIPAGRRTLAEAFRGNGYRTAGMVGAFILGREYGFAQGFDEFDATFRHFDEGMKLQVRRSAGEVVDRALKWIGGVPAGQPFFAWVHLYDAHAPYDPPAPYRTRFKTSPYDGEIAYVDASIGRLVALLDERGSLDRTLVAVVADHGEGLGDHGEKEHGMFLYDAVLHVPWIMRLPRGELAGTVVTRQVRAIDVAPTIAELAGIAPLSDVDGESVVPLMRGRAPRDAPPSYAETFYPKWHFGWSELRSVRVGDWKYIDAPRPELYDLRNDRGELKNAVEARGSLAGGLSAEMTKISAAFGNTATAKAPRPDRETLERLRSLGYVGIAAPSGTARGADPKDMVPKMEVFRAGVTRAIDALSRGQPDLAISELNRLVPINERSYELHLFLGDAYQAKRQYGLALGEYAAASVLNPQSGAPAFSAARVHLAQGDVTQAIKKLDEGAGFEPGSGEALVIRAMIAEKQGNTSQAVADYQTAVSVNPSDSHARAGLAALAMHLRQFDVAKPQFEALIAAGYRPSRMHYGLGQIAEAQADTKRAIAEYRLSLAAEPSLEVARAALARLKE